MDFLTHAAVARAPGAFLGDRRVQALLLMGTFLPDLVQKGLTLVMRAPINFGAPTHSIVGGVMLCYLVVLFVEEPLRKRAWGALFAGYLVHLFVDLWEENLGYGSSDLLYPFSTRGFEFGWLRDEHEVFVMPAAAALLLLLWLAEKGLRRVRK